MDYHIKRCTRPCATSGRELAEGETFYTVLTASGASVERLDYAADCWEGPPDDALGWWKSTMPTQASRRAKMAPNDVLLHVFDELWQSEESDADLVYVLALLLVRRRIARIEEPPAEAPTDAAPAREVMSIYCPRNETSYELTTAPPDETRIEAIQQELARLLFAEAS
ncbi:MAG: hypothetical protein R3C10_22640 [Pirellulales bacterium]